MAIAEIRLKRAENDIDTLRSTPSALMDRIDSFSETLGEARDIALENQTRLDRIDGRLDRLERRMDRLEELALENRAILLVVADHLGLTYEKPERGAQLD